MKPKRKPKQPTNITKEQAMDIKIEDIQKLREQTGVGIMEAKGALTEAAGDFEKAVEVLRKKGLSKAQKRAGREAKEGIIDCYIHHGGRIGAMIELNTETDFVAKTDDFKNLAREIALQVATMDPEYISIEDIPEDIIKKEKDIEIEKLKTEGKPENIIEKIIEGKMNNFYKQVVLLKQFYVKDENKTIEDLITEAISKLGENIKVRRFSRFQIK